MKTRASSSSPEPTPPKGPRVLGDFQLESEIARGGMGIVYHARQLSLGRRVAVKVLPAQLTLDRVSLERFKREAQLTASLRHPAIIDIYAVGEADGVHFIAMELVEGTSLGALIERLQEEETGVNPAFNAGATESGTESGTELKTRLGQRSSFAHKSHIVWAVQLIADVADALHHAHDAGVVHRDVKPSNVLVRKDTRDPVLLDFGLARQHDSVGITVTGDFAGTANYSSPEQALGRWDRVDRRSDVFSLGATLYELLTLVRAFDGSNLPVVLNKIVSKEPTSPQKINPGLPNDLVTIVLKAVEKEPERRYQTAAALAADLRAFLEYRPIDARRASTFTRGMRWIRREPLKAGLVGAFLLGLPFVSTLGWKIHRQGEELAAAEVELSGIRTEELLEDGFLTLGDLGRMDEAESIFRNVLEHTPDSLEATAGLARALFAREDIDGALELLSGARERLGSNSLIRLEAEVLSSAGRADEAFALTDGLPAPTGALELFLEGFRLVRRAQIGVITERSMAGIAERSDPSAERAIDFLSRAIVRSKNQRALFHYNLATAVWAAGSWERAVEVAETLLEFWPERDASWYYAGLAFEVVDAERALGAFTRAEAITPGYFPARSRRAALLGELGRLEESAALYRQAIDTFPEYFPALANLAASLQLLGQDEEAIEFAERAIAVEDWRPEVYDTLGTALQAVGRLHESRDALARGVELDPANPHLRNDLGWVRKQLGDLSAARANLERATELDPDLALPWFNLSIVLQESDELEPAMRALEEATAARPDWPEAWANLSSLYSAATQWDDAIYAGERAIEVAPERPVLQLNQALTLCRAGRFDQSIPFYEESLRLDPRMRETRLWLADAYAAMGELVEQLAALEGQVEAFPDDAMSWNRLAWVLVDPNGDERARDAERGLAAAQRAAELSQRQNPAILDTLAWALIAMGERPTALATMEEALGIYEAEGESSVEAKTVRASLEKLRAESE